MINIPFFIVAVVLILILIFVVKRMHSKTPDASEWADLKDDSVSTGDSVQSDNSEETQEAVDQEFSTDFLKRVQNGEKAQIFLSLAEQSDNTIIQSLLMGSGIPSHADFDHYYLVKGQGIWENSHGTEIRLSILINDYDNAKDILKSFIENKIAILEKEDNAKPMTALRDAFAKVFESKSDESTEQTSDNTKEQSLLGITIFSKESL